MSTFAKILSRFAFEDLEESGELTALQLRIGPRARHRNLTFRELAKFVIDSAGAYRAAGAGPGERIALLLPHSERLVTEFLGAIYAGMVPSIVAWPTAKMDADKYRRNLLSVVGSLRATWLLTEPEMAERLGSALGDTRVIDSDAILSPGATAGPTLNRTGTAFIQFSGGTTGSQKSVPISFDLLQHQIASYNSVLGFSSTDRFISWLPLYHDMGLVACMLIPFALRLPLVMFAPMEWVMDPRPFLRAIGEERATHCWLPNFAFSFLAARAAQSPANLDLSPLRAVINCSEPVRAESMDAFGERFRPHGLRATSLHACYAMAEATFAVTQTSDVDPPRRFRVARDALARGVLLEDPNGGRTITSCGSPIPGMDVRVVDPDNRECAPGQIGMIDIRGPSVMQGYLDAEPDASKPPFSDGWYRTGDLGAFVDGHLCVTGRQKDLIIVGGINVYPEDIEEAVSAIDGIKPGRVVALGLSDEKLGTERLIVVAEAATEATLERATAIEVEVRKTVFMTSGVAPNKAFIVPPKWIIKSTAGKIARGETRDRVLARWGELAGDEGKMEK